MKETLKHILLAVALPVAAILAFASCEHKPLLLREPLPTLVNIVFDWSALEPGDTIPEGMSLYFYNSLTGQYEKFDVACTAEPQSIRVTSGPSDLLFLNNNLNDVTSRGQYDAHTFSLLSLVPYDGLEPVYGGYMTVDVLDNPLEQNLQTLVIKPVCQVRHFNIHIAGADTMTDAKGWRATLSDLSNSRLLFDGGVPETAKSVRTIAELGGDGNVKSGTIRSFGPYYQNGYQTENNLIAYVLKGEGTISYYRFDVTDQVSAQKASHVIEVNVDITGMSELEPDDPYYPGDDSGSSFGGDGIRTDIDDFGEEHFDVIM